MDNQENAGGTQQAQTDTANQTDQASDIQKGGAALDTAGTVDDPAAIRGAGLQNETKGQYSPAAGSADPKPVDDRRQFMERFPAAGDFLKEWDALHERLDKVEGILAHHGLEGLVTAAADAEEGETESDGEGN